MRNLRTRKVLEDQKENIDEKVKEPPVTRRSSRRGVQQEVLSEEITTVVPTKMEEPQLPVSVDDNYKDEGIIADDLASPVSSEDEDADITLPKRLNRLESIASLDNDSRQSFGSPRRNFMSALGLFKPVSSLSYDSSGGTIDVNAAVDSSVVLFYENMDESSVVKTALEHDMEGLALTSKDRTEIENSKHDSTPGDTYAIKPLKNTNSSTEELEPKVEQACMSNVNTNEEQELNMEVQCEPNYDGTTEESEMGKLRSSVADAEGMALVNSYRNELEKTDEYAMQFITSFHHPVISSFRDFSRTDLSLLVPSKLKKCFNTLEQSIVYLGLIDLLATVNNNPLYGENCNAKFSKNVSTSVKKILIEFKNIIGSWALSGTETLTQRYMLVLKYLRSLAPMFSTAGFDKEFGNILDSIEKEVSRCKMNQEKIKSISSSSSISLMADIASNKKHSLTESQNTETKSTDKEIVLDVEIEIDVKLDESDDDEVSLITENKIFGKPLKASPTTEARKKAKRPIISGNNRKKDSPAVIKREQKSDKSKITTVNSNVTKFTSSPSQTKSVASIFQNANSPKSTSNRQVNQEHIGKSAIKKRVADEKLVQNNNVAKKVKLDEQSSAVNQKEEDKIGSSSDISKTVTATASVSVVEVKKPSVNAFALMMNKSRELAQKKVDKMKVSTRKLPPSIKT